MNREELIKKWLDNNLNPQEQKAFEGLEDYESLVKLSEVSKGFKPADYNTEKEYIALKSKLKPKSRTTVLRSLLRIAAVLLIGFSVFYYTSNLDSNFSTEIAEATNIMLPDNSSVELNAVSTLSYNKNSWSENREVSLDGEAFFKVAKGSKFEVITSDGKVAVLGTQFNVKQRNDYFEVTCYEGLVAVTYNSSTLNLRPGQQFLVIDGIIENRLERNLEPRWLNSESAFKSKSLKHVLSELERQYDIKIDKSNVNLDAKFSGSFTHKDLDLALKSITLPLGISYTNRNDVIVLKGE